MIGESSGCAMFYVPGAVQEKLQPMITSLAK